MIPACNIDSREREISNIEAWSRVNNLTLNQSKSAEIVFTDSRDVSYNHRRHFKESRESRR